MGALKILRRINDTGWFALPIMGIGGCIVWVLLCEAMFQLGMLPWWF